MIEGFGFLAFYSNVGGGAIGDLLFQWEQAGVFNYVLPFLLIFAMVFGILSKMNMFGSKDGTSTGKGINVVIALAVGFMSLQFNFVSVFFSEIFPRFGIALSIILVLLILAGLFIDPKNKGFMVGLSVLVLIIVAVVVLQSLDAFGWYAGYGVGYWFGGNWATVLGILVFVGLIIAVIAGSSKSNDANDNLLAQALRTKPN